MILPYEEKEPTATKPSFNIRASKDHLILF